MTNAQALRGNRQTREAGLGTRLAGLLLFAAALAAAVLPAPAQDTVCARVKIEIKQELTLERQAFDAQMKIDNTTDANIENVAVVVKVTDENGTPVAISDDPNDLAAKFFVRISNKENIAALDGSGTVGPKTTSVIDWLIIPAPGSAGASALGKKYLVGATLKYRFAAEDQTLDVSPDVITVKPLPLLTLDYFLTQDVWADDPLTPEIEPIEPFTLGVRVKNNGQATARNLKIDSAQPKIIENSQGLLINFKLDGSYVNDAPAQNTLLVDFGEIAANTAKTGRWIMETTLAGKFTEFTSTFSHADELGGMLTSILQASNAHFLIRDVRVDLPGRDAVRDFLAQDGDVIRVYESDGPDTEVTDRSGVATLTAGNNAAGNASYRLSFPATAGFIYVRLPDPFAGQKALGRVMRSDAKTLLAENVWLSKTRNEQSKQWEYWINFFDANTTGEYDSEFQAPAAVAHPPVIQFVPDRGVKEQQQVSFLVEASSPDGKPVALSAAPLPAGASFTPQAPAAGVYRATFDWTPAKGMAGSYLVVYTASDGSLTSSASARITVDATPQAMLPAEPLIDSPLSGSQVTSLKPDLVVRSAADDPSDTAASVQFELYSDEAMTQLVASGSVAKGTTPGAAGSTGLRLTTTLNDNTWYWWRARALDPASLSSPWAYGRFFVNLFNDAPQPVSIASPFVPYAEVASLQPRLVWDNTTDKDGDDIRYGVEVYSDAALTTLVASASGLAPGADGTTAWTPPVPLTDQTTYYWRVSARDSYGALTTTSARPFTVNLANPPPMQSLITSPADGSQYPSLNVLLGSRTVPDTASDTPHYLFQLDAGEGFGLGGNLLTRSLLHPTTLYGPLVFNTRYSWRVKATAGRAEADWVVGHFRTVVPPNSAPFVPSARNPALGSWVASSQPTLEVNPAYDIEGDAVHYEFELYSSPPLGTPIAHGSSEMSQWTVPNALTDQGTYWWRYRAVDARGATSTWSRPQFFRIDMGGRQPPSVQVLLPTLPAAPVLDNGRKTLTLRWMGTEHAGEANVSLYYATNKKAFSGSPIVEGLHQGAGSQATSYVWDVTDLAPGTYYVYAMIYDATGVGRSWAPGALVVPVESRTGRIQVLAGDTVTSEQARSFAIQVSLNEAPTSEVRVPVASSSLMDGAVEPASLLFTAQNWSVPQMVTVTARKDCHHNGEQKYWISIGNAQSVDPNFNGLEGGTVPATNQWTGTLTCDVDQDCDVDLYDVQIITASPDQYPLGPDDPRDGNHDGLIRAVPDANACRLLCTAPNCPVLP